MQIPDIVTCQSLMNMVTTRRYISQCQPPPGSLQTERDRACAAESKGRVSGDENEWEKSMQTITVNCDKTKGQSWNVDNDTIKRGYKKTSVLHQSNPAVPTRSLSYRQFPRRWVTSLHQSSLHLPNHHNKFNMVENGWLSRNIIHGSCRILQPWTIPPHAAASVFDK